MYDVEDLLDDWQVEADHKVAAAGDMSCSWIACLPSVPGLSRLIFCVAFRSEIATRIENINSNLEKLTSETPTLQLLASQPNAEKKVSRFNSSRIADTCSFQLDSEIVGIDDDATDLADRITGDSNRAHSLFAITGMGGIGKTTLARKVFNHHLIQNRFNKNTVWVCISGNCSGEELLKEIVRFFDKNYSESRLSLNELSSKLIEVVKEKRVFIVLDDVWDSRVWEKFLRVPLYAAAKHSRILITTRNQQVAMKMNAARTHPMTNMLQSDGWLMLCKIVFKEEDKGDMIELEKVGKEIVDRCKGLPLAINVVGGVLRLTDRTIAAWTRVLSSRTWSMPDLPEDVLPSLLFSYEDLPLHLKQCFAYCSLFPEDYLISRSNLEHLWIAEGFIKKEEGKDVEYSARDYYNELVMRNLLQAGGPLHCKMHDLLRSLAVFVSQNQYIYLQPEDFPNSGLTRRHYLSFIENDMNDEVLSQEIKEEYCVRTLLLSDNPRIMIVSPELLSSLRRLRVLDLQATGIKTLPDSLGALIHLRIFDISDTEIRELSDSLGALIHLRFLNVSHTELRKLPDSIKNLKNLETLEATGLFQLRSFRRLPSLGDMPKLQRLQIWYAESVVELGSEFLGSSKFPKLQELELKGMIKLERMFDVEEEAFPCLVKLSITDCPQLISLGKGLNHATCLKMLSVRYLDNLKTIENLSSISELTLVSNETLSSVKNLPSLKIMDICRCSALKDVRNVGELNYLYIQNDEMETLPRWLENITPPKELCVEGSEEFVLRTQQSVEEQNILKKCLYAEVTTVDESKYISYRKDLKFVATQFRRRHSKQLRHTYRLYSQQWKTWAACYIQAAWRCYSRRKFEESLFEQENRLQDP